MRKTFYILDGHYLIFRAFYGITDGGRLTSPKGEPTAATHVFCQTLFNLIRQRRPDYLVMTLDVSDETTFRRELDPDYKAHRDPAPEALHVQADRIVSIVQAMGVPILRVPGFEADDVMATLAEAHRNEDVTIYFVSRDKDLDQLLSNKVRLFDPVKQVEVDPVSLLADKGFTPEQAVEVQSLAGDSTDNVPGVEGVGVKTAVKLIQQYGTAQAVIDNADKLTPKMSERVKAFAPLLPVTRRLVTLRRDVPLSFQLGNAEIKRLRFDNVWPIFSELGFTTVRDNLANLAKELGLDSPRPRESAERAGASGAGPAAAHSTRAATDLNRAATVRERTSNDDNDSSSVHASSAEPAADRVRVTTADAPGRYELVDSVEALDRFAKALAKQTVFAFDTETTGLKALQSDIVGLSIAWEAGVAYYLPVRAAMGESLPIALVVERLGPIFADAAIRKVGHNMKFDMLALRSIGVMVRGAHFDTMIASYLLEPLRRSHSLDFLAKNLLGHDMIPITDLIGKGRDQITMDQVDTGRVCEYAAEDADYTWRLFELFEPHMSGSHVASLFHETEMPLVGVLTEMERHGVAIDVAQLKSLSAEFGDRLVELTREVHRAAGHPFNIDSPKQLATVLFDEQGFAPVRNTKTGRSTDADTLDALTEQTENPIPRLVLEYRELSKLKGTYVDTLPTMVFAKTGRVHASFNQIGAITGRLSSQDPNLQNIPIRTDMGKRIRKAFVAGDAKHLLLSADYSQVELRLLAHFCRDDALLDAFRKGQDIHRSVAAQVNGVPLDSVTPQQRSAAKAVNFGIIYGQTAFGLSRGLGIPVGEAKTFIDMYFMKYPGIRMFIDRCIAEARSKGYAETILGRRRPIEELTSRNRATVALGERLAVNTVVQGSAADLIKRAMVAIQADIDGGRCDARMLLQVHDELVFEVPRSSVDAVAILVRERMAKAIPLNVPVEVDVNWGPSWADSK